MAVIKPTALKAINESSINAPCSSLQSLTAAALVLPGLLTAISAQGAEDEEVDFQYSHYQEGKRDIAVTNGVSPTATRSFNPIEADSLHGSAKIKINDRVKFSFNYQQDTWAGATPLSTVPFLTEAANNAILGKNSTVTGASPFVLGRRLFLDSKYRPVAASDQSDPGTGMPIYVLTPQSAKMTHIMAMASTETRKQGDFKLGYEWDNAVVTAGGGVSIEDDYESRFGNVGTRLDFNQKNTTLNIDLSYTNSLTRAMLDHDDYTLSRLVPKQYLKKGAYGGHLIQGVREDWSPHLGLTQLISQNSLISFDASYTRSTGYQSNPYKGVSIAFIDPNPIVQFDAPAGGYLANISTYKENRPELRNQWNFGGRFAQFVPELDAALHFDYRFSTDDWGIHGHTFEADWVQPLGRNWTVTPRIRYYSQDAANFYSPYLLVKQAENPAVVDNLGRDIWLGADGKDYILDLSGSGWYVDSEGNAGSFDQSYTKKTQKLDRKSLPKHYSSDQRLSGYGALSGGVTLTKQFAKGLSLETGFEYYTHQGNLKLGGDGEGAYANFDYWMANATLTANLEAMSRSLFESSGKHNYHHHQAAAPAGVMFDHLLAADEMMVGYRYMWSSQSGQYLNGSQTTNNQDIINHACGPNPCYLAPSSMVMSMHMIDLMYAPTDWLTLMAMPQFVDMQMDMRSLTPNQTPGLDMGLGGHYHHHLQNAHETGGIGDLGLYGLFKVFASDTHHVHATAGLSVPIGESAQQFRRAHQLDGGYQDYAMQLGSGSWDFKPNLTYTGQWQAWSWGGQLSGTVRMEDRNSSGYLLGNLFQATAWGGYAINQWLNASIRGVFTQTGKIQGHYKGANSDSSDAFINNDGSYTSILKFGPNDYPQNSGGQFGDVGFGLSAKIPVGGYAGSKISVEWLQPVYTDFKGYQLDRDGSLAATWSAAF